MLSKSQQTALEVEQVMQDIYRHIGIDFRTYVTSLNKKGITITETFS
jgi:hypothetical protein